MTKQLLDLEACKRIASLMVNVEPTPNPKMPYMLVIHPYTSYRQVTYHTGDKNDPIKMIDIIDDLDGRTLWQDKLQKLIEEAKDIYHVLCIMNGPYMMNYLRLISKNIYDKKTLADLLKYCWTSQEFPNWNERGHALRTCMSLFKKVRTYIMDEDEQQVFDKLPDEITIYRGQFNVNKDKPYPALSWTPNPDRAFWFIQHRYTPNGIFYKGTIKKEHAICYLNNRGEEELIVDYTKIENIEEVNYDA